ncbi:hypothetical protein GJ496_011774 [Pomphorhynchus laevis]|nr:hypothetical protein GJ496_011774 [Pomphorhynchus laevis]
MEDDWIKLPTNEKIEHKLWKARLAGYEECRILFDKSDANAEVTKLCQYVKGFSTDSNEAAKDKGLEALLSFVNNISIAKRYVAEFAPGLVTKCLAGRAKSKELATEIIITSIEIECQDIILEELIKGCESKQPKIAQASIQILHTAFRDFGPKVIPLKSVVKQASSLIEHRDKSVREEAKLAFIDCYHWIGSALNSKLSSLKPVIKSELEDECKAITEIQSKPNRFLRSQRPKVIEESETECHQQNIDNEEADDQKSDIDVLEDLVEPFDILSKLPTDFYEKIVEKKWQERRAVLEMLQNLSAKPLFTDGNYNELLSALKKVISSDTNVLLVVIAAKCLSSLASGLKKRFDRSQIPFYIEACLIRSKEKNAAAVESLKEASNALYDCDRDIENIANVVVPLLIHKVPQIRQNSTEFLIRSFSLMSSAKVTKKFLKLYFPTLLKNCAAAEVYVRDPTFNAIAVLLKKNSQLVKPLLSELDSVKADKINQFVIQTDVLITKDAANTNVNANTAAVPNKETIANRSDKLTKSNPQLKKTASSRNAVSKSNKAAGNNAKKQQQSAAPSTSSPASTESEISLETAEEMLQPIIDEDTLKMMLDSNWKERLAAISKFLQILQSTDIHNISSQAILLVLLRKPGLKDANYQTLKARIDVIDFLAANKPPSLLCMKMVVTDLVDKLSDIKNGPSIKATLFNLCEWVGFPDSVEKILEASVKCKSVKVTVIGLEWFSAALNDFGSKNLNSNNLVSILKTAAGNANASVRSAALFALTTLHLYFGAGVLKAFADEKYYQQLITDCDKNVGKTAPAPSRGLKQTKTKDTDEDNVESVEDVVNDYSNDNDDLQPSTNIVSVDRINLPSLVSSSTLEKLSDKSWKIRIEGIEELTEIVKRHKHISPSLGDIMNIIKQRLSDSNKLVATSALTFLQHLVTGLGSHIKPYISLLLPSIYHLLIDHKVTIRQGAIIVLNTMSDAVGLSPLIEGDIFINALNSKNPLLKSDLCDWLMNACNKHMKKINVIDLKAVVPAVFSCIEDRNPDVRTKATCCLVPFIQILGYSSMVTIANNVKTGDRQVILPLLEKASKEITNDITHKATLGVSMLETNTDESRLTSAVSVATSADVISSLGEAQTRNATKKPSALKACDPKCGDTVVPFPEDAIMIHSDKASRLAGFKLLGNKAFKNDIPDGNAALRKDMEPYFCASILNQLFSNDFKLHICAISILMKEAECNLETTLSNLDFILRWIALRLNERNSSVTIRSLEYFSIVLSQISIKQCSITDLDVNAVFPCMITKIGENKEIIRKATRTAIHNLCDVYPASVVSNLLLNGVKSKNSRQRAGCIDELTQLLLKFNIVLTINNEKDIARYISDRDPVVRTAALNLLATIQVKSQPNRDIFKRIGPLPEKERSMLEERIKRISKSGLNNSVHPISENNADVNEHTFVVSMQKCDTNKGVLPCLPGQQSVNYADQRSRNHIYNGRCENGTRQEVDVFINQSELPSHTFPSNKLFDIQYYKDMVQYIPPPVERKSSTMVPISLLKNSQDCRQSICLVIAGIADSDIERSVLSIAQIHEVICNETEREMMEPHIDYLLKTCCIKLSLYLQTDVCQTDTDGVICILRWMLSLFIILVNIPKMTFSIKMGVAQDLFSNLLSICFLYKLLSNSEAGSLLARSVNVIVLQMLTNINPTTAYCALLRLLTELCTNGSKDNEKLELVMKCLWRLHRMNKISSDHFECEPVCKEMEMFLAQYSKKSNRLHNNSSSNNSSGDHLPNATIKSIVGDMLNYHHDELLSLMSCKGQCPYPHVSQNVDRAVNRQTNAIICEIKTLIANIKSDMNDYKSIKTLYKILSDNSSFNLNNFLLTETEEFCQYVNHQLSLLKNNYLKKKANFKTVQSNTYNKNFVSNLIDTSMPQELCDVPQSDKDELAKLFKQCRKSVESYKSENWAHKIPDSIQKPKVLGLNSYIDSMAKIHHRIKKIKMVNTADKTNEHTVNTSSYAKLSLLNLRNAINSKEGAKTRSIDSRDDDDSDFELLRIQPSKAKDNPAQSEQERIIAMERSAQIEALRQRLAEIRSAAGIS